VNDPGKVVQRIAEQLEALGDAFGEELFRELGRAGTPRPKEQSGGRIGGRARTGAAAGPPLDIYVTPYEVVVEAILPGLGGPHQVTVSLAGPAELLIEAFLPDRLPDGLYIQRERFVGYCVRMVTLPATVLPAASARYRHGILQLRFPRATPGSGGEGVAVLHVPPTGG